MEGAREGGETVQNGNQRPKSGTAGAKQLFHLWKGRAQGAKRDFPRVKQCRGRRSTGGAEGKPCCSQKKGWVVSNVIDHKCRAIRLIYVSHVFM